MNTTLAKNTLILCILDILKRYTDKQHTLSQKDIIKLLEEEYAMQVDRKAVKRNLMNLIELNYDIRYQEADRINKSGEEEAIYTDWYLNQTFSQIEIQLLIDAVLSYKAISNQQSKELIKKLKSLTSIYFKYKTG